MTPEQNTKLLSAIDCADLMRRFVGLEVTEAIVGSIEETATRQLWRKWERIASEWYEERPDDPPIPLYLHYRVTATHLDGGIIELALSSTEIVPLKGMEIRP